MEYDFVPALSHAPKAVTPMAKAYDRLNAVVKLTEAKLDAEHELRAMKLFIGWTMAEANEAAIAFKADDRKGLLLELIDVMNTAMAAMCVSYSIDEILEAYLSKLTAGKGSLQSVVLGILASPQGLTAPMALLDTKTRNAVMAGCRTQVLLMAESRIARRDHSNLVDNAS